MKAPGFAILCALFLISPLLIAQENLIFPDGAERTWKRPDGTTFVGVLEVRPPDTPTTGIPAANYRVDLKFGETSKRNIQLSEGYQHNWRTLHPEDAMWIRNALEWRTHGDASRAALNPAQFVDPDRVLTRNALTGGSIDLLKESRISIMAATARFALWWDQENYLPISTRGDIEDKYSDFTRGFERHFNTRSESNSNFAEVAKAMTDLFQKEYDEPVILATKQVPYCPPETLAYYAQGRQATILGLTTFRNNQREYTWRAALLSATAAGQIELELYGNRILGQVKPVDRTERMVDNPGGGAWEIEILNRNELELRNIDEQVRLFIDPYWRNDLWVFKPYLVTSKEVQSLEPPFIMPPMPEGMDGAGAMSLTVAETPAFNVRSVWKPFPIVWKNPQKLSRKWTRNDGKSVTGDLLGFFDFSQRLIKLATASSEFPVPMDTLIGSDQNFVKFSVGDSEPYHLESGTLVYELRESKEKATRIEIVFQPGSVTANYTPVSATPPEEKSLFAKAKDLVLNAGNDFEIDFAKLSFEPGGGSLSPELLIPPETETRRLCQYLESARPASHLDLPCRVIDMNQCGGMKEALPGFLYQLKMARLNAPELALFWETFARHSEFKDPLSPFVYLFRMSASTGLIPMDIISQHESTGSAVRLKLLEVKIDDFSG